MPPISVTIELSGNNVFIDILPLPLIEEYVFPSYVSMWSGTFVSITLPLMSGLLTKCASHLISLWLVVVFLNEHGQEQ